MRNKITLAVDSVTRRRRRRVVLADTAAGLFFGGLVATASLIFWIVNLPPFAEGTLLFWSFAPTLAGGTAGGVYGAFKWIDPRVSARMIDRHYSLKDRILTAFENSLRNGGGEENDTPPEIARQNRLMRLLQFSDACGQIASIDSAAVVPWRLPRYTVQAVVVVALVTILTATAPRLAWRKDIEAVEPIEELTSMAEEVKMELLPELVELEKENPDEEFLRELREEWENLVPELARETADPKETLATLSEMETALSEAIRAMDVTSMEEAVGELADALKSSEAASGAGEAIKAGDFDKASSELEKLDSSAMTKEDRQRLADRLTQAAQKMTHPAQKELASQIKRFGESLCNGKTGEAFDSACRIAEYCKTFSLRQGIGQSLGRKLAFLSLCKAGCGQYQHRKNGGSGTEKSTSLSKNWGTGSAGDPRTGEETELTGANRTPESVTGMMDDGPSEFETVESAEGGASSSRDYREVWHDYQKISESVLETEPIPLGQRQMIRRYFESIRPTDEPVPE